MDIADLNIKLNPLKDGTMAKGDAAYVLFNDDSTEAEIFLPKKNNGLVLTKTKEGNWTNKNYTLISWKGYVLQENGTAIFGGE
ncbi:hypothetical protein POV26_02260 [Aequorivita todarodis]|uniref:hypothetical protein n=1 Tax=Aequorivita todarodis TaxID=2036821 RepID=UPI00234FD680|nr:hypothetical protein [Aequorivita todarodis]MDC7999847.1 hypothetical protein [Aequorivita todarodis]